MKSPEHLGAPINYELFNCFIFKSEDVSSGKLCRTDKRVCNINGHNMKKIDVNSRLYLKVQNEKKGREQITSTFISLSSKTARLECSESRF